MIFPEMNISEPYGAVVSQSISGLEVQVNNAIKKGYVPLGGPFQQNTDNIPYWHQMVYRSD